MYRTRCLTVIRVTFRLCSALACLVESRVVNLTTLYKRAPSGSPRSMLRTILTRYRRLKVKSGLSDMLLAGSATSYKTFAMLLIPTMRRLNAAS
jgi:hypothetical protein